MKKIQIEVEKSLILADLSIGASPSIKFLPGHAQSKAKNERTDLTVQTQKIDVRDLIQSANTTDLQKAEVLETSIMNFDIQEFFTPKEGEEITFFQGLKGYAAIHLKSHPKDKIKGIF